MAETMVMISVWILPILMAVTLHEAGHAYMAYWHGDDTAAKAGRLSLNPLVHIDPIGTVILPLALILLDTGFIFGYAKPVPVYPSRLNNLPRDSILVSLAGPGANIIIALVSSLVLVLGFKFGMDQEGWLVQVLTISVVFNCLLAVFNMLPVPPLDGGRILMDFLPYNVSRSLSRVEPFGIFIVLAIIIQFPNFIIGLSNGLAQMMTGMWGGLLL